MSVFQDPHLAESVGYSAGHSNGLIVGRAQGYTNGWNAAVLDARQAIAERDQEIAHLSNEIHKGNATIRSQNKSLQEWGELAKRYQNERDKYSKLYEHEKEGLRSLIKLMQEHGFNIPTPKN